MTPTQQFIKDAIAGGWNNARKFRLSAGYIKFLTPDAEGFVEKTPIAEALLDPRAWQAAGKTRGWRAWKNYQHDFITDLQDLKTIDEALKLISS